MMLTACIGRITVPSANLYGAKYQGASSSSGSDSTSCNNLEIVARRNRMYLHFGFNGREIIAALQNVSPGDVEGYVSNRFSFALDNIILDIRPEAYIGLTIDSSNSRVN